MPPHESIGIRLEIERDGRRIHHGETSVARMARRFEDLIDWLGRENRFPDGVVLLTGTGIVPPDEFSLRHGDLVRITIDGIGTLSNPVIQGTLIRTRKVARWNPPQKNGRILPSRGCGHGQTARREFHRNGSDAAASVAS